MTIEETPVVENNDAPTDSTEELAKKKACPACGEDVADGAKVCQDCGTKLATEEASVESEFSVNGHTEPRHTWEGTLVVMGIPTGDGRMIAPGALSNRDLPLPLMAQFANPETGGHAGAVIVGNITEIQYNGNKVVGKGLFDTGEDGQRCFDLINSGIMRGVSVDLDSLKAEFADVNGSPVMKVISGRIMGATVTPFPAFAEASISMVADGDEKDVVIIVETDKGVRIDSLGEFTTGDTDDDSENETMSFNTEDAETFALSYPVEPPAWWFDDPKLDKVQPVTVDANGRVFGYIATWGSCHISFKGKCTDVPRCGTYKMFMNKTILCEGNVIKPCGVLFANTTHADGFAPANDAGQHYADTGLGLADVAIFEDDKGLVVAGAVRPDIPAHMIRVIRGSDISPDWRNVRTKKNPKGKMELVALLSVNTSGFLVESLLASGEELISQDVPGLRATMDEDELVSLVAAGMIHRITENERIATLEDRILELTDGLDYVTQFVKAVELSDQVFRAELTRKQREKELEEFRIKFSQ